MANYLRQHSGPPIRANAQTSYRGHCWRPECRAEFDPFQTIAFLRDAVIVAWCHRRILDDLAYRVDVWKHGEIAA